MYSRQEAAAEMLDDAIGAWLQGKHASAITLAGAAETGMPKIEDQTPAFDLAVATVMKFGKCDRRAAITMVNTGRDWLKHYSVERPEQISTDMTWAYVLRAFLHFRSVYPAAPLTDNMRLFVTKIDEHIQPLKEMASRIGDAVLSAAKVVSEVGTSMSRILSQGFEPKSAPPFPIRLAAPCPAPQQGDAPMDRERDRDVAEDLIEDARKTTGDSEKTDRPGQGTDQPGDGDPAKTPKD